MTRTRRNAPLRRSGLALAVLVGMLFGATPVDSTQRYWHADLGLGSS